MLNGTKIEVCCGSIEDVQIAIAFPIDRIELNSALELGGLTPSVATLREAKKLTDIPLCCMVRPRGAGFVYSDILYQTMLEDAKILLDEGADGLVFGFLNSDHTINQERTQAFTELAHSHHAEAIFHKAFDATASLEESLQFLISCGIDRILTSGGSDDIMEGSKIIGKLQEQVGEKIEFLPGGGVRKENVQIILQTCKTHQVHMTAKQSKEDHPGVYTGTSPQNLEEILHEIALMKPLP